MCAAQQHTHPIAPREIWLWTMYTAKHITPQRPMLGAVGPRLSFRVREGGMRMAKEPCAGAKEGAPNDAGVVSSELLGKYARYSSRGSCCGRVLW